MIRARTMSLINRLRLATPPIIKSAVKHAFSLDAAGRNLTVLDDDVFIASYPKSGNTWTRFLIGNIYHKKDEISFANIEDRVPDIYQNSDRRLLRLPRPRILKSHEYFDPRYARTICIVRDPRDIVVSYYYHMIKMGQIDHSFPLAEFVDLFTAGKLDTYGSWGENVGSWIGARGGCKNFLLLKYEDMLLDTSKAVRIIANFLRIDANDDDIDHAISSSSFDRMREMEKLQSDVWRPTRSSRKTESFVRSGKAGAWRTTLSQEQADAIYLEWQPLMARLDYGPRDD